MMERLVFEFLRHHNGYAHLHGYPAAAATCLEPGLAIRLQWDSTGQRYCTRCGRPATLWDKPWKNMDNATFYDNWGNVATIAETVCADHYDRLNPCLFTGMEKFAKGCTPEKPRCHRMFSECHVALVYLASTDARMENPIKVGMTLMRSTDTDDDEAEELSLERRVINGGYAHAIPFQSPTTTLWLGSAQVLESEIVKRFRLPESFARSGLAKKTTKPYFVGHDNLPRLESKAREVCEKLSKVSAELPEAIRNFTEKMELAEPVADPNPALVDVAAVEALDEKEIQFFKNRRGKQNIELEIIGVRGKYILGKDLSNGRGAVLSTNDLKGLEIGVMEI